MSQTAQQVVDPTLSDPYQTKEAYSNGPISLNIIGPCGTLVFTNVRPCLPNRLGQNTADHEAVVSARVTMPLGMIVELRNLLNKSILDQPPPMHMGSTLKQ
jgi:hypothetical protein